MKDIQSILVLMFGKVKDNEKLHFNLSYELIVNFIIAILIIADTFLLLFSDISDLSPIMVNNINNFDLFVCFALFCEFMFRFNKAEDKKAFLKDKNNIITIIAMIPVNFFVFRLLRYIKIVPLLYKGLVHFNKFLEKTHLNWSFGVLILSISSGTILFYILEHGVNKQVPNLWYSFMYVTPTIATEGSTISPKTVGGQILGLVLMITGIICFGLFTAAISSKFVKNEENQDKKELGDLKLTITNMESSINEMKSRMEELKELLKENK